MMDPMPSKRLISIVSPCFNEERDVAIHRHGLSNEMTGPTFYFLQEGKHAQAIRSLTRARLSPR